MSKILLLETDSILAANLRRLLSRDDRQVDWQVDPQEAIISIDVQPVDLVIMDLILAGRSGVEFLYELRSYPDWQSLPIIVLSSIPHREIGTALRGFEQLNVTNYYFKPVTSLRELTQKVDRLLAPVAV